MAGISPKLPLGFNKVDLGYTLNKTLKESIQQNLKNLLLTNPGEKVFDINFGVGIKSFLFENMSDSFDSKITSRISTQVAKYMPFVNIKKLDVTRSPDYNSVSISLYYSVPTVSINDILSLDIVLR
jgi:phage baseplate assembly protein W